MNDFPTKRDELAYHGRNALALPLENGLALIEQIEDGPTARRFAVELRLMCEAMDVRRADTAQAIAERDETKRKLTIWSLGLDARVAELYDELPNGPTGAAIHRNSNSLTAVNELGPKSQFLHDVDVDRRSNLVIAVDNVTRTASEWAELMGGHRNLIYARIRLGWSLRDAVLTPVRKYEKRRAEIF